MIEINVVNEYHVNVGYGTAAKSCLGDGFLEILIDGKKIGSGGDFTFEDGTERILTFNTFYQCSRKRFDFDITPVAKSFQQSRNLVALPGVFDVISEGRNYVLIPQKKRLDLIYHTTRVLHTI